MGGNVERAAIGATDEAILRVVPGAQEPGPGAPAFGTVRGQVRKVIADERADDLFRGQAQQLARRRVGVGEAAPVVEDEDGGERMREHRVPLVLAAVFLHRRAGGQVSGRFILHEK